MGKGGRYTWPSLDHPEVRAIEDALRLAGAPRALGGVEFQQLTIRVPKDLHFALRTVANATDSSINDTAIRALADYVSDEGRRAEVRKYIREAQEQFRVTLDKLKDL